MGQPADRQAALSALFALGAAVRWTSTIGLGTIGFATTAQRIRLFNAIGAEARPAMFQVEHGEQPAQRTGLPYRRLIEASWIVVTAVANDSLVSGSLELNAILTGIETALAPPPTDPGYPQRLTLGGLIHHAWIEGNILKDPGDLDGDGLLIVPLRILAP